MISSSLRLSTAARSAAVARRCYSHGTFISGPPRTRIPLIEKIAHGVVMSAGILFGPVFIMSNLEYYKRGGKPLEEEEK